MLSIFISEKYNAKSTVDEVAGLLMKMVKMQVALTLAIAHGFSNDLLNYLKTHLNRELIQSDPSGNII